MIGGGQYSFLEKKSYIRLCDGEFGYIHGVPIHYQRFEKELRYSFIKMIKEYNEESGYILAIPELFVNQSNSDLRKIEGKLQCWLPLKIEYRRIFNKNIKYADAHEFYYKDRAVQFIEMYIENKRIIFVTSLESKEKIMKSRYSSSNYKFVVTPSENSYVRSKEIKEEIEKLLFENKNNEYRVVFSAGPAGKELAYEFSKKGVICYDIGFGLKYMWDEKDYSFVI